MEYSQEITIQALSGYSKDHLRAVIIEQLAKDDDQQINNNLLVELINKYVETYEKLEVTLKEVERLSTIDILTSLYNRAYFIKAFEVEQSRFNRYGQGFSIILVDIDHFKKVNDTYGHNNGDMVLRTIGQLFKNTVRKVDICARWGGEEFIMLLTGSPLESTALLADRIRQTVEKTVFGDVGRVTVSLGVTEIQGEDTLITMVGAADKALYQAKSQGRNQVVTTVER